LAEAKRTYGKGDTHIVQATRALH
jgi:hypothetical protein